MILNFKKIILNYTKRLARKFLREPSPIVMWEKRAKQYGNRAVLNLGHSDKEIDIVTEMQKKEIFPILQQVLTGQEETVLDFGCGPGRFTLDLAEIIQGNAIGVDPIQNFLKIAPKHKNVEYRLMKGNIIPVNDRSVDVIWICLVLGGVTERHILQTLISEIERVLKNGGLIMLIENTADKVNGKYWKFRSVKFYKSLFNFAELKYFSDYYDLNERISIMAGRKHV